MPRIKRWFPVSHDINGDPEVWELTDRFGDRALRVWLEILSVSDRNESEVRGDYEYVVRALSGKCQTTTKQVRAILQYAQSKGWLHSDLPLRTCNYAKYHKLREPKEIPEGNLRGPPPSETSETSETYVLKEEEELVQSCANAPSAPPPDQFSNGQVSLPKEIELVAATATSLPVATSRAKPKEWPDEDRWLLEFLRTQEILPQLRAVPASESHIEDYGWWEQVNDAVNGVDPEFIRREFAKIGAYLSEKPRKRPTPKGWRAFIRPWLERSKEYDRKRETYTVRAIGR